MRLRTAASRDADRGARARRTTSRALSAIDTDVAVLGGGPAGAAAASILTRTGHTVTLVTPPEPPAADLCVSVPPSAERILNEVGFATAVLDGPFHPNRGNTIWWASEPIREETFEGRLGVHVDRRGLERALLSEVERRGVRLVRARVRGAVRRTDSWVIRADRDDVSESIRARLAIDATGRQGVLARSHQKRTTDDDTTTLALVRRVRRDSGWPEGDGHTWIESHADGWVWSLPVSKTERCVTAMLDQRDPSSRGSDPGSMLDEQLAHAPEIRSRIEGATPVGETWACPASLYRTDGFTSEGLLVAGDAGSFIDPLSSFGVKKALASGWLAAIVAHSLLADPDLSSEARTFFEEREADVYRKYRAASEPFFRAAADRYGTSYWERRAEAAARAGGSDSAPRARGLTSAIEPWHDAPPEEAVRAAFEQLKVRERLDADLSGRARIVQRPAIEGYRIVRQRQLVSGTYPRGLRYVRDVDLITVSELAPGVETVPDLWEAYNRVAPQVSLPDFLTALSTSIACDFLELD